MPGLTLAGGGVASMSGRGPSEDCIKREFNKEQVKCKREVPLSVSYCSFFQVDCITDTLLNREDWRRLGEW